MLASRQDWIRFCTWLTSSRLQFKGWRIEDNYLVPPTKGYMHASLGRTRQRLTIRLQFLGPMKAEARRMWPMFQESMYRLDPSVRLEIKEDAGKRSTLLVIRPLAPAGIDEEDAAAWFSRWSAAVEEFRQRSLRS